MSKRSRKRIGEKMLGIGAIGLMIFASAIDGPDNNMVVVYMGCFGSMASMITGATMADMWY